MRRTHKRDDVDGRHRPQPVGAVGGQLLGTRRGVDLKGIVGAGEDRHCDLLVVDDETRYYVTGYMVFG